MPAHKADSRTCERWRFRNPEAQPHHAADICSKKAERFQRRNFAASLLNVGEKVHGRGWKNPSFSPTFMNSAHELQEITPHEGKWFATAVSVGLDRSPTCSGVNALRFVRIKARASESMGYEPLFDGGNQMARVTLSARVGFDKHPGQPGHEIWALIQIMRD